MNWWDRVTLEERRRVSNSFFLGIMLGNPEVPEDAVLNRSAVVMGRSLGLEIEEILEAMRQNREWVDLLTESFEMLPRPYFWAFLAGFYAVSLFQYAKIYQVRPDDHSLRRIEETRSKMLEYLQNLHVPPHLYEGFVRAAAAPAAAGPTLSESFKAFISNVRLWMEGLEEMIGAAEGTTVELPPKYMQ